MVIALSGGRSNGQVICSGALSTALLAIQGCGQVFVYAQFLDGQGSNSVWSSGQSYFSTVKNLDCGCSSIDMPWHLWECPFYRGERSGCFIGTYNMCEITLTLIQTSRQEI